MASRVLSEAGLPIVSAALVSLALWIVGAPLTASFVRRQTIWRSRVRSERSERRLNVEGKCAREPIVCPAHV